MSDAVRAVHVVRRRDGATTQVSDAVAVEEPLEVRVNGAAFAVVMRTPGHDVALAAGFLLAEDVVRATDEIASDENTASALILLSRSPSSRWLASVVPSSTSRTASQRPLRPVRRSAYSVASKRPRSVSTMPACGSSTR